MKQLGFSSKKVQIYIAGRWVDVDPRDHDRKQEGIKWISTKR